MKRLSTTVVAVALAVALASPHAPRIGAQPVASITLPPPGGTIQLYEKCNNVSLTFPDGTPSETVVQAVTPEGSVQAMWRYDTALDQFEGFSPEFPAPSDLAAVDFLDVVSLCMVAGANGQWLMPPTPPNRFFGDVTLDGSPAPTGTRVIAIIEGRICGRAPVQADSPHVLDVASGWQTAGCGTEDATVDFWMGCSPAGTATWGNGDVTELDLAAVSDIDEDGCTNCWEVALGSVFDPTAWYDVYDVPVPAYPDPQPNGPRNKVVGIGDVLAVLFYVFAEEGRPPNANGVDYDSDKGVDTNGNTVPEVPPDGVADGRSYDRSSGMAEDPVTGIDPAGAPNGVIDIGDVLACLAQVFVVDCSRPGLALLPHAPTAVDCSSGGDFEVDVVNQGGVVVAGETVECTLGPPDGPLAVIPETAASGPEGTATLSMVPVGGSSWFAGQELIITCSLYSKPAVRAATTVYCSGPAVPPNRFFGDVTIDGTPAPPGTDVEASIGSRACAEATVQPGSTYLLDVASTGEVPGCGTSGAQVDFKVAGSPAGVSTWTLGRFTPLTLPVPGDATPTPTSTPLSTPEPTPTPAEGMAYVSLVEGCNAVASTYPDGEPIQTLADAVWPQEALHAIWYGGWTSPPRANMNWSGYSPLYAEQSDLEEVDRLDVVFLCVDGLATFARPEI